MQHLDLYGRSSADVRHPPADAKRLVVAASSAFERAVPL